MTSAPLVRLLEETIGAATSSLTGAEKLRDIHAWDSMSTLLFIAMADKRFGLCLPASQVLRCQTVAELLALLGNTPRLAA